VFKDIFELLGMLGDFKKTPECLEKEVTPRRHEQLGSFIFKLSFHT
jgi:hypothetical protein